jgi:hypothetical protein
MGNMRTLVRFALRATNVFLLGLGFRIDVGKTERQSFVYLAKLVVRRIIDHLRLLITGKTSLQSNADSTPEPIEVVKFSLDDQLKGALDELPSGTPHIVAISKLRNSNSWNVESQAIDPSTDSVLQLEFTYFSLVVESSTVAQNKTYRTRTVSHHKDRELAQLRRLLVFFPVTLSEAYDERGRSIDLSKSTTVYLGNGTYRGTLPDGSAVIDRTTDFRLSKELYPSMSWVSYCLYDGDRRPRIQLGDGQDYDLRNFIGGDALTNCKWPPISLEVGIDDDQRNRLRHSTLPNGFKSAIMFTLHGCWNNAALLDAVLFGKDGFKANGLGCTVSAFMGNSDNLQNSEAYGSDDSPGFALTSSPETLNLANAVAECPELELGLHCEDWIQYDDKRWGDALAEFKAKFGESNTYIDHIWYKGNGNVAGPVDSCFNGSAGASGRLDDLLAIDTKYFWNATREYIYTDWQSFTANNVTIPNALQLATHPDLDPKIVSWYTDETFSVNALDMESQASKFSDWYDLGKDSFVHCYFGNANPTNGIWTQAGEGKELKPQFSQILNSLSLWQRSGETWLPTVTQYIEFQQRLSKIHYSLSDDSNLVVSNRGEFDISGLTFVTGLNDKIAGARYLLQRGDDAYWEIETVEANSSLEFEVSHV